MSNEATKTAKELKTAKRKERVAKINAYKEEVKLWLAGVKEDLDVSVVTAIEALVSKSKKEGSTKTPQYMDIINLIIENKSVSEDEIWNQFKLGRTDMRAIIRKYIKKVIEGQEIAWILFNDEDNYELVAESITAPEGWEGPLPVVKKVVDGLVNPATEEASDSDIDEDDDSDIAL